jgi:CubicO group peptidase (beta-lactamase class C family)
MSRVQDVFNTAVEFAGLKKSGLVFCVVDATGTKHQGEAGGKGVGSLVHWGSCAKALAATVCAALVSKKALQWDSSLASLGVATGKFSSFTVGGLLRHQHGVAEDLPEEEIEELGRQTAALSPKDARKMFVAALHRLDLVDGWLYSNAGYTLLSHVLESHFNTTWEEQVQTLVCEPLGLKSLSFGMPSGLTGHDESDEPVVGFRDYPFQNAPFAVHSSLADWAVFASLFQKLLRGESGAFKVLGIDDETAAFLIEPSVGDRKKLRGLELPPGYAAGWRTRWCDEDDEAATKCLWHLGSNLVTQAAVVITPDLLILVGSNSGSMMLRFAIREACESLMSAAK